MLREGTLRLILSIQKGRNLDPRNTNKKQCQDDAFSLLKHVTLEAQVIKHNLRNMRGKRQRYKAANFRYIYKIIIIIIRKACNTQKQG